MAEERISGIEGVLGDIANSMGKKLDEHSATLKEHTRLLGLQSQQIAEVSKKIDEQEITLYEQSALIKGHTRELINIGKRMDKIEGRLDGMATKEDLAALETRMVDSFTRLLAILDERLPKKEE